MSKRILRFSKLKERATLDYPDDGTKIKCFDNQCTVEELEELPEVESQCSWDEYLWEVKYIFTEYNLVHNVHYIVRGLTALDREAYLHHMIDLDLEEFSAAGIHIDYAVDYICTEIGKLV